MKTLYKFMLIALVAVAFTFTSCSDNGPVSTNDRDANIMQSTGDGGIANPLGIIAFDYSWNGQGSGSEQCGKLGEGEEGQRPPEGWMHWLFNNKGASENALLVLRRGDEKLGEFTPQAPLNSNNWHFYTPFFEIFDDGGNRTLEAKVYLDGEGATPQLVVLSDYCPGDGRSLSVSKTVETSYTRKHKWDIEKNADTKNGYELDDYPKIWLFIDGTGDEKATWTVDVTYEGYKDKAHNVSGEITIENIGTSDKSITNVVDELGGEVIAVDCGVSLPYTLPAGDTLTCTYSKDGYVEGINVVTVTVEGEDDPYEATEPIVWGNPTNELYETVNVKDISDLFDEVDLGTVTEPNSKTFTYKKFFKWADFGADGCGSFNYDNTAYIVETGQSDDATLKVNVQCFVYESAWAKGDNPENPDYDNAKKVVPFCEDFNNWGWTNKIGYGTYEWDLWAGAGQCDITKGTLVGKVVVNYNGDLDEDDVEYILYGQNVLKEKHVYAGKDKYPKLPNGRETTAPGRYTIHNSLSGDIWVIAHGVVGLPDPNFGP